MSDWSLSKILSSLHDSIHNDLEAARLSLQHPGTKGDASENIWLELFNNYLPKRYRADKATVVDSNNNFSDQLDVVIYDRQYSPFIFNFKGQIIIPAECVYAVFEAKQEIKADYIKYSRNKVASVRKLHRTSLPIPYAKGVYPAKSPQHIFGGILALESYWRPPLGASLLKALEGPYNEDRLDFGCITEHGYFYYDTDTDLYHTNEKEKHATGFLFHLLSRLQFSGTVPMIDINAYSRWLIED